MSEYFSATKEDATLNELVGKDVAAKDEVADVSGEEYANAEAKQMADTDAQAEPGFPELIDTRPSPIPPHPRKERRGGVSLEDISEDDRIIMYASPFSVCCVDVQLRSLLVLWV